jgi:hypothetical protein
MRHGLADALSKGDVGVASQGTAALLYATDQGHMPLLGCLAAMRREPWADGVLAGADLGQRGLAPKGGIVAAVNMAGRADHNPYGVAGKRWTVAVSGKPEDIGCGQHGGWGTNETRPFLLINHPARPAGDITVPTSLLDIAPTSLTFLGLRTDGMDGQTVQAARAA